LRYKNFDIIYGWRYELYALYEKRQEGVKERYSGKRLTLDGMMIQTKVQTLYL